jgi:hypothetical protein
MNNYTFESFNKAENGLYRNELKKTDLISLSTYRRTYKQKWLKFAEAIFNDFTNNGCKFQNIYDSRLIIMDIIVSSLVHSDKGVLVNEEAYYPRISRKDFLVIIRKLEEYGLIYILQEYTDEKNTRHAQAIYPTIQLPKVFDALKFYENRMAVIKKDNIKKMHEDITKIHEDITKIEENIVTDKNNFDEMKSEISQIVSKATQEVTSEHSNIYGGI